MVIPFDSVQKLYNEYCHYMMINDEFDDLASPSLFYKAWKDYTGPESLSKFELRLSGCKGSFNTCEICNNAAEFLKYNKKHNGNYNCNICVSFSLINYCRSFIHICSKRGFLSISKDSS
jgi:hypothetical protein